MRLLADGKPYSIEECVEAADIEKQKQNILYKQYAKTDNYDIQEYRYCTGEIILRFIDESVDLLREML